MSSVSVVIPCYRYGHFLEEAVRSVLDDQAGVDVRVLIIDDASPDDSAEVARGIAARDPRVEVLVHASNQGHISTYNEGLLEWADGDYSVLMSADDRLTPGSLRRAVGLLDAHPRAGFAYGNVIWFADGSAGRQARTGLHGWTVRDGEQWIARRFRQARTGIISPEVVVRTSVQKRVGGYDPRLPHVGDQEMWIRLAASSDVGFLRGVDQAYYRRHMGSMSTTYDALSDLRQRRVAFEVVLARCSADLRNAAQLADVVHRRLAWEALLSAARAYDRGRTREMPVDELVAFALDCWPAARRLAVYRTLAVRQHLGSSAMQRISPLVLPFALIRRLQSSWIDLKWSAYG